MKPMTAEAVKRLALANGAALHLDGRAINAARLLVAGRPQPKPEPVESPPAPAVEAQPVHALQDALHSLDQYAASQSAINESNMRVMEAVQQMLQQLAIREVFSQTNIPEPEKRPAQWVFQVKRDERGLIETITASAK